MGRGVGRQALKGPPSARSKHLWTRGGQNGGDMNERRGAGRREEGAWVTGIENGKEKNDQGVPLPLSNPPVTGQGGELKV